MKKHLLALIPMVVCIAFLTACVDRTAIIQGEISDPKINLSISDQYPFDDTPFNPLSREYAVPIKDSIWEIEFDGKSPRVEQFNIPYNFATSQQVFITPGDKVSFKVVFLPKEDFNKNGTTCFLEFSGKNAAHYNFFSILYTALKSNNPNYFKIKDIAQYNSALVKWRDDRLAFLEQYCKDNTVSRDFKKYARSYILNNYIFRLYNSFEFFGVPFSDMPADYLGVDEKLMNENFMNAFGPALMLKHVKYFASDPYAHFDEIYQNINKSVSGYSRDYLVAGMIGFFAANQVQSYRESLLDAAKKELVQIKDADLVEYIEKAKEYYLMASQPIPDSVLSQTYLKSYGEEQPITLAEVMKNHESKVIFIDFWASWCSPCRIDISESTEAKKFMKEKGVEWIYLATDDNEAYWRQAAEKDQITDNQYLVLNHKESPLLKYFAVTSIPRYIILDQEHNVKVLNASRPNLDSTEALKREVNDCFQVVFSF